MWFVYIFSIIAALAARGAAGKDFYDYDDEDFIPYTGKRYDLFDWKLSAAIDEREPGNVIASPASVKFLLILLYEAATGETSLELQRILQLSEIRSVNRVRNSALLKSLQASNPNYELEIGFRLYADKTLHPKNWYKQVLAQFYSAYIQMIDFSKTEQAVEEINHWTNYVTHGHINKLIDEAETLRDAILVMVNAVYFHGKWKYPFPHEDSYNGVFLSPDGIQPQRFMTLTELFYYSESDELDAKLLRIPYKGRKFSLYVLLPRRVDGLNLTLSLIRPFILRRMMWQLEETSVSVTLPIFQFEYTINLKKILNDMGITSIFESLDELHGINARSQSGKINPAVSSIIQKASIEINEVGTIAAAATGIKFVNKVGIPELIFNASHPFLFFIENEESGTVVFEGKYVHPGITSSQLDTPGSSDLPLVPPEEAPAPGDDLKRFVNSRTGGSEAKLTKKYKSDRRRESRATEKESNEFINEAYKPHARKKGNLDGTPWEFSKSP